MTWDGFLVTIDRQHIGERKPIPIRIRFYIDGYGAKKTSESLYDAGIQKLNERLGSQLEADAAKSMREYFKAPKTPEVLAEILGYCLGLVELHVISVIEYRLRAGGRPMFPNALLVNQSSPMNIDFSTRSINILDALYPVDDNQLNSNEYLDASCEGIIYRPKKIDREKEIQILNREIADSRGDASRISWLTSNIRSINDGIFYYRKRDGKIGERIDFDSTEKFFDEVSDRIGYYSRLGERKILWRHDLDGFGEKGVDCDLIMQVMDDLHGNEVDVFVIMTNYMDFFPLIERIQEDGKHAFLCGLRDKVSSRLTKSLPQSSFFDLSKDAILQNLPTVFMTLKKPEIRSSALQWAWLALRREAESNSRQS
jgi:uncharacterized LabA/DUF88 family protein